MGTKYNYEIGYEQLIKDFQSYQKQTPKGVSLQNKRNKTIVLKFKLNDAPKSKGCNCTFTIDGMIDAVKKARKVAEAIKTIDSETEFWQWYDKEILEKNQIENDLVTFEVAIAKVEDDFWSRPDRRKRKRDKNNPSDLSSWNDTYGRFYEHLPLNKVINLDDVMTVINKWDKGTKTYKGVASAMKYLARMNKQKAILDELNELNVTQTKYKDLKSIALNEFLEWRDKTLGITTELHPNAHLDVRKAWLWIFSTQVVYGLRIHEVFAIRNLHEPFKTKDGVTIPALSDKNNKDNLIVIGAYTNLGTTTKTNYRLARPNIPPKYPDLLERLEIKASLVPDNKSESENYDTIRKFYCNKAYEQLERWNAPITESHAFRHLANINGMQAGIPLEVRAQSFGHTPAMNDSTYKKRQGTQTTIDLLLNSNTQAIDFVTALNAAKALTKDNPDSKQVIALLVAKIYQKDSSEIIKLL
jgi:integrase